MPTDHYHIPIATLVKQYATEFQATFNSPLREYFNKSTSLAPYMGFDLLAFDSLIPSNKGESLREAIIRLHGRKAFHMIEVLTMTRTFPRS